jgi:hypothetical protein
MRKSVPKKSWLNYVGEQSIRKPLAWLSFLFIIFVVLYCLKAFGDIPPGTQNILMALIAIPCAVIGSSSYEAVRIPENQTSDTEESESNAE